ncbi:Anion exchange transporter [Chelonia mydas]|uniref:Anion exchange transporter n=1 Tax=Chelonia mydas TaxID=8469 RepID=M7CM43_CHEMY|nr:Anion exchange transporter [Chelonia mydas]
MGRHVATAMFVLHLGSATFLLTEPVISAMTTGAATHVVTSQVKYLLGMKMPYISGPLGFFYIYAYIFENIKSVQLEALLLSLVSLVVLVLVKELNEKFKRKIKIVLPIDLILIIATSIGCYCADMEYTYGLAVVGHIPEGIPAPKAPSMNILSEVVTEAFGVALVGYVASLALAQGSAKQFKYSVDDNQELLAHGLSNVIPSFFFCIPSAAAMGRTALLYSTGAKTQCVLASIIVVGLKGMLMQFRDLKKYWNVDKIDWSIWVSTYVFTVCFAANVGLLYGVVCTIVIVIFRFQRAKTLSLKNMKEVECEFKTEADCCEQNTLLNPVSNGNCHASLVKAMQYSGNLGSENPIFFESVSSAIGAIHVNRFKCYCLLGICPSGAESSSSLSVFQVAMICSIVTTRRREEEGNSVEFHIYLKYCIYLMSQAALYFMDPA